MRTILVLLCIAIPISGCYSRRVMPVEEVRKLHGFEAGDEVKLPQQTTFTECCPLAFIADGVEGEAHKYVKIRVVDDRFAGWTSDTNEPVVVDLSEVDQAVVYVPQIGTVILTVVITALGLVVFAIVLYALLVAVALIVLMIMLFSGCLS